MPTVSGSSAHAEPSYGLLLVNQIRGYALRLSQHHAGNFGQRHQDHHHVLALHQLFHPIRKTYRISHHGHDFPFHTASSTYSGLYLYM